MHRVLQFALVIRFAQVIYRAVVNRRALFSGFLFLLLPIAATLAPSDAYAQGAKVDPQTEATELFTWFDQLGFEDISTLPFVKVETGDWSPLVYGPKINQTIYGFLISDIDGRFKICSISLGVYDFKATPPVTPTNNAVGYEHADLATYARSLINSNKKLEEEQAAPFVTRPRQRLGHFLQEGSEALIIARACAAINQHDLSLELVQLAKQNFEINISDTTTKLKQTFADDLAQMSLWRIILDFGKAEITRSQLLQRLDRCINNFPDSSHHKQFVNMAAVLRKMVAEDQTHQSIANFDQLSTDEQVAVLIYRLRNQVRPPRESNYYIRGDYQRLNQKRTSEPKELSPAEQLNDFGFDAVPQLIESLDDDRLTRFVDSRSDSFFSHNVLSCGGVAKQILNRISNDCIHDLAKFDPFDADAKDPPPYKERAQQWWKEVQPKGETQFLIESLESRSRNTLSIAKRLAAKYPNAALQPLINCEMDSNSQAEKCELIKVIASLGEPAEDYLLDEMKNGVYLTSRVTAATMLQTRMPETAIDSMLADWAGLNRNGRFADVVQEDQPDGVALLIRYFAAQDSAEHIEMMHESYEKHSIANRMEMVLAVCDPKSHWFYNKVFLSDAYANIERNAKLDDAIEALLVTALNDTREKAKMKGSWGNFVFNQPRICDIAAYFLQSRFPGKYQFDLDAWVAVKDIQRIRAINQWRRRHDQVIIPEYKTHQVSTAPASKTGPILKVILETENNGQIDDAIELLEAMGVGALPATVETLGSLNDQNQQQKSLAELAKRLSTSVATIAYSPDSMPIPAELEDEINAYAGRPLTRELLIEIAESVVVSLPDRSAGIELVARRDCVDSAIRLEVTVVKMWPPTEGYPKNWGLSWNVKTHLERLGSNHRDCQLGEIKQDENFRRFDEKIAEAFQADIDVPFEIRFSLTKQK